MRFVGTVEQKTTFYNTNAYKRPIMRLFKKIHLQYKIKVMDNQPSVEVFKRVNTVVKKRPKTILKKVKCDGSVSQASKIVDKLIANKTRYFEVCNLMDNKKVIYQLNISGKNYTTKIVKT